MGRKRQKDEVKAKRRKVNITIETKKEIIARYEKGIRVRDLAVQYGTASSTICTILKNKDIIKDADVARGITVLTRQRSQTIEQMEKSLLVWINDRFAAGELVNEPTICNKARALHRELARSEGDKDAFKASRGWYDNFKKRIGLCNVSKNEEHEDQTDFVGALDDFLQVDVVDNYERHQIKIENTADDFKDGQTTGEPVPNEDDAVSNGEFSDVKNNQTSPNEISVICENKVNAEEENFKNKQVHPCSDVIRIKEECPTSPENESLKTDNATDAVPAPSLIRDILVKWNQVRTFVKRHHPDRLETRRSVNVFNNNVLSHFRSVLKRAEER